MILTIRITACIMWAIAGVMSNTPEGYLSAAASGLFLIALLKEIGL